MGRWSLGLKEGCLIFVRRVSLSFYRGESGLFLFFSREGANCFILRGGGGGGGGGGRGLF